MIQFKAVKLKELNEMNNNSSIEVKSVLPEGNGFYLVGYSGGSK